MPNNYSNTTTMANEVAERIKALPTHSWIDYNKANQDYETLIQKLIALGTAASDLINLSQDENANVRYAAVLALGEVGTKVGEPLINQIINALIQRLQDKGYHTSYDWYMWEDLPEDELIYASASDSSKQGKWKEQHLYVSDAAAQSLLKIGQPTIPSLIQALTKDVEETKAVL